MALYLGLTLVFSWPLALHLSDAAIRVRSGDVWQNLWNIWWVPHALFELHSNPFHTSLIYYPDSPTLYLHALYPLAGLISAPFQWLFGLVTTFNLLVILMISLSGFCAYLLGRYLELSQGAALLVGTIFAYSPIISSQLDQGQLEQISPLWLPLFMIFFLKALRTPNFGRTFWLNCAGAGLCFLLTALTTWYYALNLVLFSAFVAVWVTIRALSISPGRLVWTFGRLGGIALLCALFTAPLLYPTLKEASSSTYALARNSSVLYNSADIVHFFRPGNSALWFTQVEPEYEFQWFLGFIPLALALFAAFTDWRRARLWLALTLFFVVLALGPVLKLGLENYTSIEWLPTGWLQKLPLGSIVRVPIRFVTLAMLCLGIAAAFGLDALTGKINNRFTIAPTETSELGEVGANRIRPLPLRQVKGAYAIRPYQFKRLLPVLLPALAIGLVFLEFYPGPRTLVEFKPPNFLEQIKQGPPGAVLEMPLLKIQPLAMYEQTRHGKPIVGGYLARKPNFDFMERTPGVRELAQLATSPDAPEFSSNNLSAIGLPILNLYNIHYIIVHHDWMTPEDQIKVKSMLTLVLGDKLQPVARDGGAELYRVPEYSGPVANAWGEVNPDSWYEIEGKADDLHRWSAGDSELYLFNPNKEARKFQLNLSLYSYAEPQRTIEFWLNGQLIKKVEITPALQPEKIELLLPPGRSTLGLKGSGPTIRPKKVGDGNDSRPLNFGIKQLSLTPL